MVKLIVNMNLSHTLNITFVLFTLLDTSFPTLTSHSNIRCVPVEAPIHQQQQQQRDLL